MKLRMSAPHRRNHNYRRGDAHWLGAAVAAALVTMPFAVVLWVVPVPVLLA